MTNRELGFDSFFSNIWNQQAKGELIPCRVVAEHKERYVVKDQEGEYDAEITGNIRFTAQSREDFPAVGDWVAILPNAAGPAIIHWVFPRYSLLKRQAAGHVSDAQVIGANIDTAFLVQAADRDFNINRLERYLSLCHASRIQPVILLTKTDLVPPQAIRELLDETGSRIPGIEALGVSNASRKGYQELLKRIQAGKTYCLLGSSGVGKSSLLNGLSGQTLMSTDAISAHTGKGRHITTHRELIVLPSGGMLIDNPGMREVGIADSGEGLKTTFDQIFSLSKNCRYADCTHSSEKGCAVHEALESGLLDPLAFENYLKLEREKAYFESSQLEKRRKEKTFGKIMKNYKKDLGRNAVPGK